jgi:hypothetical protein
MSEDGSEDNSDSEFYEDEGTDGTNVADVGSHHWNPNNQRTHRRQSIHVPLPSTFQHYGSFYLRMGAVGMLLEIFKFLYYLGIKFGNCSCAFIGYLNPPIAIHSHTSFYFIVVRLQNIIFYFLVIILYY